MKFIAKALVVLLIVQAVAVVLSSPSSGLIASMFSEIPIDMPLVFADSSEAKNDVNETTPSCDEEVDQVDKSQQSCRDNLGECMTWCNPKIRVANNDCTDGTHCCVLVV